MYTLVCVLSCVSLYRQLSDCIHIHIKFRDFFVVGQSCVAFSTHREAIYIWTKLSMRDILYSTPRISTKVGMDMLLMPGNKPRVDFSIFPQCWKLWLFVKMSRINKIWPYKSHFSSAFGYHSSDFDKIWHAHSTWPWTQAFTILFIFFYISKMATGGHKVNFDKFSS